MKTTQFRIRHRDWRKLRAAFPGVRGETAGDYFTRLTKWLEGVLNYGNRKSKRNRT